jgi:antitoxin ChpS
LLISTLRNVGGSVMMAIPKSVLDGLGLSANTKVALSIEHGRLVVEAHPKPRYSLAELLAQCDPAAPEADRDDAWDSMEPVGREVL